MESLSLHLPACLPATPQLPTPHTQTARHVLQPADESLMLLGAGAVAALSPAEAVLLMHRFGQVRGIRVMGALGRCAHAADTSCLRYSMHCVPSV